MWLILTVTTLWSGTYYYDPLFKVKTYRRVVIGLTASDRAIICMMVEFKPPSSEHKYVTSMCPSTGNTEMCAPFLTQLTTCWAHCLTVLVPCYLSTPCGTCHRSLCRNPSGGKMWPKGPPAFTMFSRSSCAFPPFLLSRLVFHSSIHFFSRFYQNL